MTWDEAAEHWFPARARFEIPDGGHNNTSGRMPSVRLCQLLGLKPYNHTGAWGNIELTEELKHTLRLLAGPHGYAIARILAERNGVKLEFDKLVISSL